MHLIMSTTYETQMIQLRLQLLSIRLSKTPTLTSRASNGLCITRAGHVKELLRFSLRPQKYNVQGRWHGCYRMAP